MKTVHEVSALTGISIRTLQYYDQIGLLPPAKRTEAGYRLYDDAALERLQQILLFRSLEFPLKEIKAILASPRFDPRQALEDQIHLLELRKQHIENLITLAKGMKAMGMKHLNFTAFDMKKIDEYTKEAKARWGNTSEYKQFEEKDQGRTDADRQQLSDEMMGLFAELGKLRMGDPAAPEAQALVQRLQAFITEHFYTCTDSILLGLGRMYAGGGDMTENIDRAGGEGTGEFVFRAIKAYCGNGRQK